jgi:hypothetical protein
MISATRFCGRGAAGDSGKPKSASVSSFMQHTFARPLPGRLTQPGHL